MGATVLGTIDSARLGSAGIALAVIPLFAAMGLIAGAITAALERVVAGRPWWIAAFVLTAPAMLVFVPVAGSLFEGAYAQTLPLAGAAPYVLPIVLWGVAAMIVALGRHVLRAGDLYARAIGVLGVAAAIGATVWAERHVLGTGYRTAHVGATVALIAMFGIAVRITYRGAMPYLVAAVLTGLSIGGSIIACLGGLRAAEDRQALATYGDQSRDLVSMGG